MSNSALILEYSVINSIALAFLTLVIHAPVLMWRARTKYAWDLSYGTSLVVAFKANGISFLVSILILSIMISGGNAVDEANSLAGLVGILSWWLVHSNAIFSKANGDPTFTVKNARYFSLTIFGWNFLALISISLIIVFVGSIA